MNNILNAQDAFAALQMGKNILCRYTGGQFASLDDCPATVFGLPGYEFCIEIEKIELAGITFTKPLTLDEYQEGQEVFVICTYAPSIYVMNFKTSALVESINSGFVQRDPENAELQLKAISKALGCEFKGNVTVTRLGKEPSKPKRKKEQQTTLTTVDPQIQQIEHNKDLVIDAIATCVTADDVEATCYGLDRNGFNEAQLEAISAAKLAKLGQLAQAKTAAESEDHELFNQDKLEPELSVLCDAFVSEINNANSKHALNEVRRRINSNDELSEVEHAELATRINIKLASFEETKLDDVLEPRKETGHYFDQVKKETAEWNTQLQDLLAHLENTKTPEEANALVSDTKTWTEDQRQPLLRAISRRLQEFQNPKPSEKPSLAVQIQNAPDLTALDALEIDVSSLDVVIQPEMLRLITTRRLQLENAANDESQAS